MDTLQYVYSVQTYVAPAVHHVRGAGVARADGRVEVHDGVARVIARHVEEHALIDGAVVAQRLHHLVLEGEMKRRFCTC